MGVEALIKLIVSLIGEYLFVPAKAAKYAKWFLRARDYLLILFPLDRYPTTGLLGTAFEGADVNKLAVPVDAVKTEMTKRDFNIPFIKGM